MGDVIFNNVRQCGHAKAVFQMFLNLFQVTGSNKGVGFAVVRALCKSYHGDVFLTSRGVGRGQAAIADLNKEGLQPKFHQLDINDRSSVDQLKSFLQTTYGGLDVLVNNAGIAYKKAHPAPFSERAEVTCKTNFWATLDVCRVLFPLLRPHASIPPCHSTITECSTAVQGRFKDPSLTMNGLEKIMQKFVDCALLCAVLSRQVNTRTMDSQTRRASCPRSGSFIQDREIRKDSREDIVINTCCSGSVTTDMSSHQGTKTIDEGEQFCRTYSETPGCDVVCVPVQV
ncbi:carbonyl reductase [NADPH] 1-like [Haliotis rufescens]|uniref:carbonyl reductase [NADPH] 1-like n=1 Tax=Haliotis rufescens TaxID=6454 RepID=UPI00201E78BC|nr:carbonyl reductase [NADPH] 1-like [Haliotis rufescens]